MGETDCVLHIINTGQARFIKQAPRRIPIYQKEEVSQELKRMLDVGVIKPSKSPWGSPIVIVRKSDGSIRFCVDDRKVSYPLPRINDSLDVLHKSSWYSVLDLQSGFWEVKMDPSDQEKTAFVTDSGLYEFTKMPFSLCNSSATFERLMESALAGLQWETCLVYIDNIIIFLIPWKLNNIDRLSDVLKRISQRGLKIFPKKCNLFQRKSSI